MNRFQSFSPLSLVLIVSFLTTLNLFIYSEKIKRDNARNLVEKSSDVQGHGDGTIQYKCLSTDEVASLVSEFPRLHVLSAAKSGGSSLKSIVTLCMNEWQKKYGISVRHNINDYKVYHGNEEQLQTVRLSFMKDNLNPHPASASHILPGMLGDFVDTLPSTNLAIYSHRQELSRLKSAIEYVARVRFIGPVLGWYGQMTPEMKEVIDSFNTIIEGDDKHGAIDEGSLIEIISSQSNELAHDESHMLTCEVYESIQANKPNFIFMSSGSIGEFQEVLFEEYCPGKEEEDSIRINEAHTESVSVLAEDGNVYDLSDWIDEKLDILEWALNLRQPGCRGETKAMEEVLFNCPSGFVQAVGSGRVAWNHK